MTAAVEHFRVKNLRPDLDGHIVRMIVPNDVGSNHANLEPVSALRAEIYFADGPIKAALRRGDMDSAWTLVSRKVGLRIVAGDIVVKLKKHRL